MTLGFHFSFVSPLPDHRFRQVSILFLQRFSLHPLFTLLYRSHLFTLNLLFLRDSPPWPCRSHQMRAVIPLFGQQCTTKILPTSFVEYLLISTSIVSPYTSTSPPMPPSQKHRSSTKHSKTHYHQPSTAKRATVIPTSTLPMSTCAEHWTLSMPWAAAHPTSTFVIQMRTMTIHQHPPVPNLLFQHHALCHRASQTISRPQFGTIYPLSNRHHESSNTVPHRPLQHTLPLMLLSKLTSSLPHP